MTTATESTTSLSPEMRMAVARAQIPTERWINGDRYCHCTFQRLGDWTNPYIARTKRVRLCCIWAELEKMFPQFVQDIPAYYDQNRNQWVTEPAPWDSPDSSMPVSLWFRQLSVLTGRPMEEIEDEYSERLDERPAPLWSPLMTLVNKDGGPLMTIQRAPQPTRAERAAAIEAEQRAAGWIL